jgi:hypothetical protein
MQSQEELRKRLISLQMMRFFNSSTGSEQQTRQPTANGLYMSVRYY